MKVPAALVVFMKATSSICGPNDDVVIPRGATKTDWEVELGVVISSPPRATWRRLHPLYEPATWRRNHHGNPLPELAWAKNPPLYLKPGNRMRLGVDGLGEQNQNVVAEST